MKILVTIDIGELSNPLEMDSLDTHLIRNTLRIVDSFDFQIITEVEYPSNLMFHLSNNVLKYVLNGCEVYSLDIATNKLSKIFHNENPKNTYLAFLNDSLIMEDVRVREKRKVISKKVRIIDLNKSEVIVQYNDDFEFLKLHEDDLHYFIIQKITFLRVGV